MKNQILETKRLYLREFSSYDYIDLCEILQDKDVMYAYEHSFSEKEVKIWYDKLIANHYRTSLKTSVFGDVHMDMLHYIYEAKGLEE